MACEAVKEIYFSPAGTTKRIVERVTAGISLPKTTYNLLKDFESLPQGLCKDDCLIVGLPVYSGRIPALTAKRLAELKGENTPAIAIVVYGNREYEDALLELKSLLTECGFIVIAAAAFVAEHSIFPVVASGRPDEKDFEAIDLFAKHCAEKLENFSPLSAKEIAVKGNFPYREISSLPICPSGNSKCNGCGACVKICPTHAISSENPKETDKGRCISCTACIAACPQKSRGFHGPMYVAAKIAFSKKCKARKESETFE